MNTVRMILCGNVEDSRMNPSEKVGVVSVVFVIWSHFSACWIHLSIQ
jgi:hypothetical protein